MLVIKKIISVVLVMILLIVPFSACQKNRMDKINLTYSKNEIEHTYHFAEKVNTPFVKLNPLQKDNMLGLINQISVNYSEADLYKTEECFDRLNVEINISQHQYSALNENGVLDAKHLEGIIKANNEKYLAEKNVGFLHKPDEKFLKNLSELIVDVVNDMQVMYPDVDYDRVYCNLGNLKVLEKGSLLSYAEVTEEMVLHISSTSSTIKNTQNGELGYRDTMVHEIIHLIQFGCVCEQQKYNNVRVGLSRSYEDFDVNTSKLEWVFEGSAELIKRNTLGAEKGIYANLINYINTINLSTMFNPEIPARYTESLCFYDDIDKLYNMFGCETKEEKLEILNMLITINIIQYAPDEIISQYGEKHGVDIKDEKVTDYINYSIKPEACLTLTKIFYKTITELLAEEENITLDDLCFMISLYETTMNYHLLLNKETSAEHNAEYLNNYKMLRDSLFEYVSQSSGIDVAYYFAEYEIINADSDKAELSATMKWNDAEKNDFLIGRVEFFGNMVKEKVN